jgi:hypothetical protein
LRHGSSVKSLTHTLSGVETVNDLWSRFGAGASVLEESVHGR